MRYPSRVANKIQRVCLVGGALLPGLLFLVVGGDRFFSMPGTVRDCATGAPLPDVDIQVVLDKGIGEEPSEIQTDGDGRFHAFMNEPPSSWATLEFTHSEYRSLRQQYRGLPEEEVTLCLEPRASRGTPGERWANRSPAPGSPVR